MFPLYDNTRRQICITVFLGLCVLPTLTITAWGIARRLPWHKQAEEQRLALELGLEVSIDSMKHTLPGVVQYAGVRLTDPETGSELLRCTELTATWTAMSDSRPAIVLAAAQAESPVSAGSGCMTSCAAGWNARLVGRRSKFASRPTNGRCTTVTRRRFSRLSSRRASDPCPTAPASRPN